MNKSSNDDLYLLGLKLKAYPADEASEIIWENLEVPKITKEKRRFWVFLVSFLFLFCLLSLFIYLKQRLAMSRFYYDQLVDCSAYYTMFDSEDRFKSYAE
jgi:hypothetical protein